MQSLQKSRTKSDCDEFQIDFYPDNNLESIIIDYAPESYFFEIDDFIIDINRNIDFQVNRESLQEITIPPSIIQFDELISYLNINYNDGEVYYTRWKKHCFVLRSPIVQFDN